MVRGHREGYTAGESFRYIRNVFIGVDVEASALTTTFLFSFANHLYEKHLDIFAADSEPTWLFGSVIKYVLERRNKTPTPDAHARQIQRCDVDGAQFGMLQKHASKIVNRCHVFEGTKITCTESVTGAELDTKRRKLLHGSESNEQPFQPLSSLHVDAAPFIGSTTPIYLGYSIMGENEASLYPSSAFLANYGSQFASDQPYAG